MTAFVKSSCFASCDCQKIKEKKSQKMITCVLSQNYLSCISVLVVQTFPKMSQFGHSLSVARENKPMFESVVGDAGGAKL